MTGVEPAHLAVLEPKSSASANSATSPYLFPIASLRILDRKLTLLANRKLEAYVNWIVSWKLRPLESLCYLAGGGYYPDLQVAADLLVQVYFHSIQAQFLERTL